METDLQHLIMTTIAMTTAAVEWMVIILEFVQEQIRPFNLPQLPFRLRVLRVLHHLPEMTLIYRSWNIKAGKIRDIHVLGCVLATWQGIVLDHFLVSCAE